MADSLRDLVVSLSLNTDNFTRNIKSVSKQIQEAESEFRLASAGVKDFESTSAGLSSKLEMLERKLSLQKDAVGQYERALTAASDKLTECFTRQNDYTRRLEDAKQRQSELRTELDRATQSYEHYRSTLGDTDAATIAAQQNMESARQEYNAATQEVEKLSGQCDALRKSTQNAADAVTTAETQLNKAKAGLRETEAAIKDTNAQLLTAKSAWTAAGTALTDFSKKCESVSKSAISIGRTLTRTITAPIVSLGVGAVKAGIDFESSFASVRKTVDATEAEFDMLADTSKRMSTEIAASTDTINEVMATGGQLGIQTRYLEDFTRVMIDLGNSCEDLSADEAATSIAKFANVMGTDQQLFKNIGSTIVALGNNFATTEKPIMEMAQRLAGAGRQVGLTEAQVLGFAAALSSVGIEAQMGGSSFSKALIKMEVACATGNGDLKEFASISAMTADAFKALFESDPASAFQAFLVGLSKIDEEGESAIAVLNDMGIKEIRLRDTLLRSVNATELFSNAQQMANTAWAENTALTVEAGKRYATTASKLTNLKNRALLFSQQLGDDLNPTVIKLIEGADGVIQKLLEADSTERTQIMRWAAIAAAIGPATFAFGKLTKGVGAITGKIGKFATAVGTAGGGFKGFLSVLESAPAVWIAATAGVTAGTLALIDFLSGARAARNALNGMTETAARWKETAADTFYGKSEGLSFFGMSDADFQKSADSAREWLDGVLALWSDGDKETNEEISQWTDSFFALTDSTRTELKSLEAAARNSGLTSVAESVRADIAKLDEADKKVKRFLKDKQNGYFSEKDEITLSDLVDTREEIEVRYHLSAGSTDGFDEITRKVEVEIARAQARGQNGAAVSVYENALVAAAQGIQAVNAQIDEQYDREFYLIRLIADADERSSKQAELDAKYRDLRIEAAREYAQTVSGFISPVLEKDSIRKAGDDIRGLIRLMTQYSVSSADERTEILEQMNALSAGMDEAALTEYVSLLTQVQSLLDAGLGTDEIASIFPEIDYSTALDQIASIQAFVSERSNELSGLAQMFGEALPEEIITVATDLDMTGAQARWNEFAANPGAITTNAIIESYSVGENAKAPNPAVDALISSYTEIPQGADKSSLTPEGLTAYVSMYAEKIGGANVSGITPRNITALVTAYKELAAGADVSALTPSEITAYIGKYLEKQGVDVSGLSPDAITAFVVAYEEASGGAKTTALTPTDIAAFVTKYLLAENTDVSALTEPQINALVTAFAEATNCDKTGLHAEVVAQITAYEDAEGVVRPSFIQTKVSITGYDLSAYRRFLRENPVEVEGTVRLNEVYEDPALALTDPDAAFWQNGVEVPASAVMKEQLRPDTVAILDGDGTMHILVTPEITGTEEAVKSAEEALNTKEHQGSIGARLFGDTTLDDVKRLNKYLTDINHEMNSWFNIGGWMNGWDRNAASSTLSNYLDMEEIGAIQSYVAETVAAINSGMTVSDETVENLTSLLDLVKLLDAIGIGENVTAGIAEGMTDAGFDTDAETVAANLEGAIQRALQIQSPSGRMIPVGEYVSAGIGAGTVAYDFSSDAAQAAFALESSVRAATNGIPFSDIGASVASALGSGINPGSMSAIGASAMAGLAAGVNAGRSGVISAMRSAAAAAVTAAKLALQIHSPSRVFRDEIGAMAMKGLGEGIQAETEAQAKVIRNAARFLTGEAKSGALAYANTDNRRTYNQQSTVNLTVSNLTVRDKQDIQSLAIEIAALTKRRQIGCGIT